MTEAERNALLVAMTEEVGALVLHNNYQQTLAISVAETRAASYNEIYLRWMQELEKAGRLNRSLEFLPSEKQLRERKAKGKGLTRPEIAVLLAYTKTFIKEEILNSTLADDPNVSGIIATAFPACLQEKFPKEMQAHKLRRELVATQLSNRLVNEMGLTFCHRLQDETGASVPTIVRAYGVVREIIGFSSVLEELRLLDGVVPSDAQSDILVAVMRLARRATRWFLQSRRGTLEQEDLVFYFKPKFEVLLKAFLLFS